jgi:uncharacterized repeat protein (TIGR03803 family)
MKAGKTLLLWVLAIFVVNTVASKAQTLTVLHSFTNTPDGATPFAGLLLSGGTLYGTTQKGGPNSAGSVYSVNTDGTAYQVLHNFTDEPDGAHPLAGLVLSGNTLYGATAQGGSNGFGSLFALNTNGDAYGYSVLWSFNPSSNGVLPNASLTLAGGNLFGVASGEGYGIPGWGTVFSVNTNGGDFTALYSFSTPHGVPLTNTDGEQPQCALALSGGILYGTAYGGGSNGYGTIFSVQTNASNFTVLHTFVNSPDGAYPQAGLTLAGDMLYGTTSAGGTNGKGAVFSIATNGMSYAMLHSFATNGIDGTNPYANLTLSGNILFGTTRGGGSAEHGTVFSMATNGAGYTVLYNFTNSPDGAAPQSALVAFGNALYGTTSDGGISVWGTVFSIALEPPAISSVNVAGRNLVLGVTNVLGRNYALLTSPNFELPLNQWTPIATNSSSTGENLTIIATNAIIGSATAQFYILQAQ